MANQENIIFKSLCLNERNKIVESMNGQNIMCNVISNDELVIDDSMQPEVKLGVGRMEIIEKIGSNAPKNRKRKRMEDLLQWKIHESSMETWRKIHEEKESAKRRRHEEKMELLSQIVRKLGSESKSSEPKV
ncbi:uncharacterized protein LOC122502529 [Leptopilina heterotoma]|uniref:uncharacterized protein LOC122502529 n=1 Tax=Leptopilina heterotoma TaxID=63436 RepID=UPI001CA9C696|nr:uncharacterized protein LOC122502529 [Leptopilina heterotoma]